MKTSAVGDTIISMLGRSLAAIIIPPSSPCKPHIGRWTLDPWTLDAIGIIIPSSPTQLGCYWSSCPYSVTQTMRRTLSLCQQDCSKWSLHKNKLVDLMLNCKNHAIKLICEDTPRGLYYIVSWFALEIKLSEGWFERVRAEGHC